MDKLVCMRAFVTVVEASGFSEAARRLRVSKALISRQVNQLEEHLDTRLLNRTTRHVSTTSSGQAYFEQCRELLIEFDELDAAVQSNDDNPRGELRVTAPISFAELHLMTVVSDFSRRYPDVRMCLDLSDRFVDLIEDRIDVAIRIGALSESTLVARKIGNTSMQLCASPDYLARRSEPVKPEQLQEHACIVDNNYPGANRWTLGTSDSTVTIAVSSDIELNGARAARELVLLGHGIGFLPSFAITDDLTRGNLIGLLPDYACEPIGIYAVYPNRKHLSAKVRLFIDMAIDYCKEGACR